MQRSGVGCAPASAGGDAPSAGADAALGGDSLAPTPAWRSTKNRQPRTTSYGAAEKIALPTGTTAVWKVYLSAQATKVDVLALVTQRGNNSDAAYWDTQVPQPASAG